MLKFEKSTGHQKEILTVSYICLEIRAVSKTLLFGYAQPGTKHRQRRVQGLQGLAVKEVMRSKGNEEFLEGKPESPRNPCQGLESFSIKGHIGHILGFAGHLVSVAATQLYHCSMKAAIDNM